MSEPLRPTLGIDLGGTAVKVGVVTRTGEIIGRAQRATEALAGVDAVVANMVAAANEALLQAAVPLTEVEGIGVGAPGLCDAENGTVLYGTNLGWRDVPVAALLERVFERPVLLDNDANCAALGEQWCGAARGRQHVIMVTLGTGVGGALILGGRMFHGQGGWAGEVGHIRAVADGLACNCGRFGCLETVASATAMVRAAEREIGAGRAPALALRAAAQKGRVDGRLIIAAAQEGDGPARMILREAGEALGRAMADVVTVLNPQLVVVGGGVSRAGDLLLQPMRSAIAAQAMPATAAAAEVVAAALGNDAGLIGAASLVWRQ